MQCKCKCCTEMKGGTWNPFFESRSTNARWVRNAWPTATMRSTGNTAAESTKNQRKDLKKHSKHHHTSHTRTHTLLLEVLLLALLPCCATLGGMNEGCIVKNTTALVGDHYCTYEVVVERCGARGCISARRVHPNSAPSISSRTPWIWIGCNSRYITQEIWQLRLPSPVWARKMDVQTSVHKPLTPTLCLPKVLVPRA